MRKFTLLVMFVFLSVFIAKAQEEEILFEEDFATTPSGEVPADWIAYDEDGDGQNWRVTQIVDNDENPVGGKLLLSASYENLFGPLTPDNWAVTPAIDLSEVGEDETVTLVWEVAGVDANFSDENYTVYAATGDQVSDFLNSDLSYNEIVTENGPGGLDNFYEKELDITELAGEENVHIALRHHDVTDVYLIVIKSVKVVLSSDMSLDKQKIEGFSYFYDANNMNLNLSAETALSGIKLYNLLGQEVLSNKLSSSNETINLSEFSSGIYLAKVEVNGKVTSFKIAVK